MSDDAQWMRKALLLAQKGEFTATPNPCVGCVIVQENQLVGQGLHWQAGTAHAECHALREAAERAKGATCYVTLEPCAHTGRTGPCVEALIQSKVAKVVFANHDPNPLVRGKGEQALKEAGIVVTTGVLASEARKQNLGFFSRMLRQRPYIRAKIAMSLDGKIAMASGESQWITGPLARAHAHVWRAKSGAILTTARTVNQDDCRLTVRDVPALAQLPQGIHYSPPLRVIVDSTSNLSKQAKIFAEPGKIAIAVLEKNMPKDPLGFWGKEAVEWVCLPEKEGHINIVELLHWLAKTKEVNDLMIEAGANFTGALLRQGCIDELLLYVAPKFLGDEAISMVKLPGFSKLSEHIAGQFSEVAYQGQDLYMNVLLSDFARGDCGYASN